MQLEAVDAVRKAADAAGQPWTQSENQRFPTADHRCRYRDSNRKCFAPRVAKLFWPGRCYSDSEAPEVGTVADHVAQANLLRFVSESLTRL
jgi:hypothetical protein